MAASTSTRSLSRDQYATIAEEILNIFKAGWYRPHRGPRVDLASDLRFSVDNTVLYTETDFDASEEERTTAASVLPTIEVRHCTTLQAARSLADEIDANRVGVLNFASAKNPGGGFLKGSNAQEESLARSSSLYFALNQERIFTHFYGHHRHDKNGIYTHRLIYSPRVTVCKDDHGKLLPSAYHMAVVTSPAPNASIVRDPPAVREAMDERIRRILHAFKLHEHDCLVLGAFGCGVFQNDPREVALLFRKHLQSEAFANCFHRILFAILDSEMCRIFSQVFLVEEQV